jgi:modulator of FtsH protease HflC
MTTETEVKKTHWPTMLLGVIVAAIFLVAIFSFQVNTTESAIITTLDKIDDRAIEPGLHFRWPYPIQKIYKFDKRLRCFGGSIGKLEDAVVKTGQTVTLKIFVLYRIDNVKKFFNQLGSADTVQRGEEQLNIWLRDVKLETFGKYDFNQLLNVDPKKMKLHEIEIAMQKKLAKVSKSYGFEIKGVGIEAINIPESISKDVFDRMNNERKVKAEEYTSEGTKKAQEIITEADKERSFILTAAQADAKMIRAEGDAEAAKYYETFKKNPELAIFLRKLDALGNIMQEKTTLILDTDSAPFDMLKMNASNLQSGKINQNKVTK